MKNFLGISCGRFWGGRWNSYTKGDGSVDTVEKYELNAIWKKRYESTIRENIGIMEEILKLCNERSIVPTVIVPPILTSCLKDGSLALLEKGKKDFYEIITGFKEAFSMCLYDFVELYKDRKELFLDCRHLNEAGKQEFTKRINEILSD